jgi:glycosyltransferase involved in cell wall biosynthesis
MPVTLETLIVTLCSADRRDSILRAIDSVLSQDGGEMIPVIVINGQRYDAKFRQQLEDRKDLRVVYLSEGNLFLARKAAREAVTAEYFSWLDDDDIYFPGAMKKRLAPMVEDPTIDVVISNGIIKEPDTERLLFDSAADVQADPIAALFKQNWLAAGGGLYRTSSIPTDYFDASVRSLDMTHLALRLAIEKNIRFIEDSTFRKNKTPGSVSSTIAWMLPASETLRLMLDFPLSNQHRRMLRTKLGDAQHVLSDYYRQNGNRKDAWRNHLASLASPGGLLKYGAYTRRLIFPSLTGAPVSASDITQQTANGRENTTQSAPDTSKAPSL